MTKFDQKAMAVAIQALGRLDANESIFFARELEHILSRVVNVQFPLLKARTLIPVNTSANAGDKNITFRVWEALGVAKIIADAANDLPRVDVKATEVTSPIKIIGDAFGWTIKEIQAARKTGKALESTLVSIAREAAMREENRVAWAGDTAHKLPGLLTNPNITEFTLPADGAGASKLFSTKSPDQIARDLHSIANTPFTTSKGVFMANTMLLSLDIWTLVTTTRMPDGQTTVLDYFRASNPFVTNIDWLNELTDSGAGSTDKILVYNRNPQTLEMHLPEDFTTVPPQAKGLEFEVNAYQQTGGVTVYEPLAIAFADGAA